MSEADYENALTEQQQALDEIDMMLMSGESEELSEVRDQLVVGIAELEQALLEVKRDKLMLMLEGSASVAAPPREDRGQLGDEDDEGKDGGDREAAIAEGRGGEQEAEEENDDDYGDDYESGGDEEEESGGEEGDAPMAWGVDMLGHARLAAAAGAQTDTAHFAEWEENSRGIASKLLARMGYVKGQGLGREGKGIIAPLEISLLPARRGLGGGVKEQAAGGKRRKRGGERARRKKHVERCWQEKEAARQEAHEKEVQGGAPGLFALINNSLGDGSEAAANIRRAVEGVGGGLSGPGRGWMADDRQAPRAGRGGRVGRGGQPQDRRGLVEQQDAVAQVKGKLVQLDAMLQRNKGDKVLRLQIEARMAETQREVAAAEAEVRRLQRAIGDSESERKWRKF